MSKKTQAALLTTILSHILAGLMLFSTLSLGQCSNQASTSPPPSPQIEPPRAAQEDFEAFVESAERMARFEATISAFERVDEGRKQVEDFARRRYGHDANVTLIGTRGGHPAFNVSHPEAKERSLVIATPEGSRTGPAGFWRLVADEEENATLIASAWLLLVQGLAREPLGPWSSPPAPLPSWNQGKLSFHYLDENKARKEVSLEIDSAGRSLHPSAQQNPR